MVKRLINKLRGTIRKGILLATAGLVFNGCQLPEPNPYTTEAPTPTATSEPTPGPTPTPDTDYFDISGRLEDNENHGIGRQGVIKIYDASNPNIEDDLKTGDFSDVTPLTEISTDSNGYFSATLDKLNSELPDGIVARAKIGNESTQTSYVRTISFPQGDQSDVLIRAIPYPDFDGNGTPDNIAEFKQHVIETNSFQRKWDLDQFSKIKIFKYNGSDSFTDEQINNTINKIKDSENVEKFVNGKELDNYIEVVDGSPIEYWEDNCVYVVPNDNLTGGVGVAYTQEVPGRKLIRGKIEINPCATGTDNPVLTHEFGHIFAETGHAVILPSDKTIMLPTGNILLKPGVADIKETKLLYENTHNAGEDVEKVLGTGW